MVSNWEANRDLGVGLALMMGILAGIGGLLMIAGALDRLAAVGFALAVVAGIIGVWAIHAYPS